VFCVFTNTCGCLTYFATYCVNFLIVILEASLENRFTTHVGLIYGVNKVSTVYGYIFRILHLLRKICVVIGGMSVGEVEIILLIEPGRVTTLIK